MANLLFIIVWLTVALAINASLARYIKAKLAPVAMSLLVVSNPTSSLRSSQSTSASDYNTYSSNYDTVNSGKIADTLGITDLRRSAADFIKGDVLEVAAGTGLQLEYNNWEKIRSYLAVDNSEGMLQQLQQRISSKAPDIQKKFSQKVQDAENLESLDKVGELLND